MRDKEHSIYQAAQVVYDCTVFLKVTYFLDLGEYSAHSSYAYHQQVPSVWKEATDKEGQDYQYINK